MISIRKKQSNDRGHKAVGISGVKSGFLNLSQKSDYGLILLSALVEAGDNDPHSLKTIAEKKEVSFFFLQKVALDLRKAGLIKALRGKSGGYVLSNDPKKISMKEILEALEGPIMLVKCLEHESDLLACARENRCHVRRGFGILNNLIIDTIKDFTLYDFLNSTWKKGSQKKV